MTSPATPLCESPDCANPTMGFVCRSCMDQLDSDLRAVPEILGDLMITACRQDVGDPGVGGGGAGEAPLLYRPEATEAGRDLHAVLASWVRQLLALDGLTMADVIPEERPPGVPFGPLRPPVPGQVTYGELHPAPGYGGRFPDDDTLELSMWLARHRHTIQYHSGAGALVDEVGDAVARCRHATDRPSARVYLGACACSLPGERQVDLYAHPDAVRCTCRQCGEVWDVEKRRAQLLKMSGDLLVTAEQAARALPKLLGYDLTVERVKMLYRRQGLPRHPPTAWDPHKRWRYRVSDLVATLGEYREKLDARAGNIRVAPPIDELPAGLRALFDAGRRAAAARTAAAPAPSGVTDVIVLEG